MRHRKFTFKIGRSSAHRKSLLANAVCSLIHSGRIQTTVTKAKQVRRLADRMITLGKRGTLHARRQAIAKLHNVDAVKLLFSEVAPQHENRCGGYTRIIRTGQRAGDAAEMCLLEFVEPMEAAPAEAPTEAADTAEKTETAE